MDYKWKCCSMLFNVLLFNQVSHGGSQTRQNGLIRTLLFFFTWDVLILLNFWHVLPERTQTWGLGTTESEVWIGNFNVKTWKTTKHEFHKIWRSLKFRKRSAKQAHPSCCSNSHYIFLNALESIFIIQQKKIYKKIQRLDQGLNPCD